MLGFLDRTGQNIVYARSPALVAPHPPTSQFGGLEHVNTCSIFMERWNGVEEQTVGDIVFRQAATPSMRQSD